MIMEAIMPPFGPGYGIQPTLSLKPTDKADLWPWKVIGFGGGNMTDVLLRLAKVPGLSPHTIVEVSKPVAVAAATFANAGPWARENAAEGLRKAVEKQRNSPGYQI